MPAFYEAELFTVNVKELSETASASIPDRIASLVAGLHKY